MTSGVPIDQPCGYWGAGGRSWIALRRAVGDPPQDGALLGRGEASLVEERSGRHGGVPRRHGPFRDLVPDVPCVRPDIVVRQQRHRRDFPWPVARRAVLIKDGGDILCIGGHVGGRRPCALRAGRQGAETGRHDRSKTQQVPHRCYSGAAKQGADNSNTADWTEKHVNGLRTQSRVVAGSGQRSWTLVAGSARRRLSRNGPSDKLWRARRSAR